MKQIKFKKAFALSIVLWIVAALLFGIATLASISKDTLNLSSGLKHKITTNLVAEDILESLKFYFLTADYGNQAFMNDNLNDFVYKFPSKIILDNRWYTISKDIKFRVQDHSGLINLFHLHPDEAAFVVTSRDERQKRYILSDSIRDWTDKNNVPSLNGAEESTYRLKKNLDFKPRNNADIQHVQELRLVNGFDNLDEKEWQKIKKLFYFGAGSRVNLALLGPKHLSFFLKIDIDYAKSLLKLKEEDMQKFIKIISAFENYNDETMGFYISKEVKIQIVVSSDDAKTNLVCHIDFDRLNNKLYTVFEYTNN